jgi:hypothetical protein
VVPGGSDEVPVQGLLRFKKKHYSNMQNTNKNVVEGQHDLIIIKIVVMSTSTTISSTRR